MCKTHVWIVILNDFEDLSEAVNGNYDSLQTEQAVWVTSETLQRERHNVIVFELFKHICFKVVQFSIRYKRADSPR